VRFVVPLLLKLFALAVALLVVTVRLGGVLGLSA
jgi:hypothetical protein